MGLLRLLLALAVVAAHAGAPFGAAWLRMTGGPLSVQVFYVISGFYMSLILNEKYVGAGSYAAFARSRLLRIVPMFLAVLAATIATAFVLQAAVGVRIQPLARWHEHGAAMPWPDWLLLAVTNATIVGQDAVSFFAIDPQTHALFFTPDFHREEVPAWQFLWVPQAWTVGVELLFYGLAPLLVRRRPRTIALVLLGSLALRVALMRRFGVYHDPWTYRFFPTELALFLAGVLAWHAHRWLRARGWLRPAACWLAALAMLALVAGYELLPGAARSSRYGLAVLLAVVPLLLPFVFEATRSNRVDRALGELSYPVYLVHYLLVFVVAALDGGWIARHADLLVPAATLLLAIVLWRCIGVPLEGRRQRIGARLAAEHADARAVGRPRASRTGAA